VHGFRAQTRHKKADYVHSGFFIAGSSPQVRGDGLQKAGNR
jgi:hypothetical protein